MFHVRWEWRPLTDAEVDLTFLVSPLFGTLHTLPSGRHFDRRLPARFKAMGFFDSRRNASGWDYEVIEPPARNPTWYHPDTRHSEWSSNIVKTLHYKPLMLVINDVERAARQHLRVSPPQPTEIGTLAEEALSAWTFCRLPECLPRALFRYSWLRRRGICPRLVIGVHLPTDRMHAWLEMNDRVLGEEPDEMLCYQGAVRFFAGRPTSLA